MPSPPPSPPPSPWSPPPELPDSFSTDRLTLRFYTPDDAPALYDAVSSSRDSLHPWLPWALTGHLSPRDSLDMIARLAEARRNPFDPAPEHAIGYVVGMFENATGALLGGTGFNRFDPAAHNAETGYWVRADRRRQGWCAHALAAMLSWGFTPQPRGGFGFRRVHIFASAANAASAAVPRKLGLHQHHHARLDRFVPTLGWTDTLGWDVLASEWDIAARRLRDPS